MSTFKKDFLWDFKHRTCCANRLIRLIIFMLLPFWNFENCLYSAETLGHFFILDVLHQYFIFFLGLLLVIRHLLFLFRLLEVLWSYHCCHKCPVLLNGSNSILIIRNSSKFQQFQSHSLPLTGQLPSMMSKD